MNKKMIITNRSVLLSCVKKRGYKSIEECIDKIELQYLNKKRRSRKIRTSKYIPIDINTFSKIIYLLHINYNELYNILYRDIIIEEKDWE